MEAKHTNLKGSNQTINQRNMRARRRQKLKDLLGGKCSQCGSTENLQFHHVDKEKKKFVITTRLNNSWKDLVKEAKKCVLLCKKCHFALHMEAGEIGYQKKCKKVLCLDTGEVFRSVRACASKMGLHPSRVWYACERKDKYHVKYHFKYVD